MNHRHFQEHIGWKSTQAIAYRGKISQESDLFITALESRACFEEASEQEPSPETPAASESARQDCIFGDTEKKSFGSKAESEKGSPYCLWSQVTGALASQKKQRQTPGFDPAVGGIIVAFDINGEKSSGGVGSAYVFSHVSEKENVGYSCINQEYLFGYASWMNKHFYLDGVLWLGLFQTHQVRKIDFNGFEFRSASSPSGWQVSPHLEVGYDFTSIWKKDGSLELIVDPFVMLDWVNAWQKAYQEHGSSPFNAGQKAHYSSLLRSEVGFRFYQTCFYKAWSCTFEEKMSYVNKTPFKVGRVNAFLVGSPGTFTLETLTASQNLGVVGAAFIAAPADRAYPYGAISYQGEWSPSYQSHQITTEISWDF